MDWRKIEEALIAIARINSVEMCNMNGHTSIGCEDTDGDIIDLSLTELAKELAERLA